MTGTGPGAGGAVGVVLAASEAEVAGRVEADFGFRPVALDRVAGGADSAAVVWRASGPDGTEYAAKLSARPEMVAGLIVTAHLAANGVAGVPAPVPAVTGRLCSVADGAVLSLTPWVRGRPAADVGLGAGQWRWFGAMLAAVHAVDRPGSIAADLPRETYATPMVGQARELDAHLRSTRGAAADELTAAVAATWLDGSDRLLALAERAEALGRSLRRRHTPTVLCHGDAHILNVLVGDDARLTLIDWDEVILAPPERDLMFVVGGGVLGDPLVTPEQQRWFFEGYDEIVPEVIVDADRLAFYRCSRAVDDAAQFARLALEAGRPAADRRSALDFLRLVLSPGGLVTLAGEW